MISYCQNIIKTVHQEWFRFRWLLSNEGFKVWKCKARRKHNNTLPSCLWFPSYTTIVLLQCYSNKLLMMYSYEIFCITWTFLWIPPHLHPPDKSVSRLHSFDSFVCIVKHWEQYTARILQKPCFLLCQCVCTVCLRAVEAKRSDWGPKCDCFLCVWLSLPGMMKSTYGWDPGAPGRRKTQTFESCLEGFVFRVRKEQKIITTNC